MRTFEFKLSDYLDIDTDAYVEAFVNSPLIEVDANRLYPTILMCPGGGYSFTSNREAEPVALRYVGAGYNVFVLRYSTTSNSDKHYPTQLLEVCGAMHIIRANYLKWHSKPNALVVMGYSAGGHLASMCATMYNEPIVLDKVGDDCRPDGAILCYPVISADPSVAHMGSMRNLSGIEDGNYDFLSTDLRVDENTPPCYIWHCSDDKTVPVENSLRYATQLARYGVPFEMKIYPFGGHGGSLHSEIVVSEANPLAIRVENQGWLDESIAFLKKIGMKITYDNK